VNLKNLAKYGKWSRVKHGEGSLDYGFVRSPTYIIIDQNAIEDVLERLIDISIKDLKRQAKKSGKEVSDDMIEFVKDYTSGRLEPMSITEFKDIVFRTFYDVKDFSYTSFTGMFPRTVTPKSFDELPKYDKEFWIEIYNRGVATLRLNGVLSLLEEFEKYPEIQVKEFYHLTQDNKEYPNIILMRGEDDKNYFFNADIISFVLKYIDADDIVVSVYGSDFFVCKFYSGGDLMAVIAGYRITDLVNTDIDELKKSIEIGESMFNSIEEIKV
jgi:hypothetical protein